jgi:hypothetical protein
MAAEEDVLTDLISKQIRAVEAVLVNVLEQHAALEVV